MWKITTYTNQNIAFRSVDIKDIAVVGCVCEWGCEMRTICIDRYAIPALLLIN